MILPLTERQARARGLSRRHTAYAADGAAVGDYCRVGLVRLDVPDCSPVPPSRWVPSGHRWAAHQPAALALLTTRPDGAQN